MSSDDAFTDFMDLKHRRFFRYLDTDNDGRLYYQDTVKRTESMAVLNVINEEESQKTRAAWQNVCAMIYPSQKEFMTEDEYILVLRKIFQDGRRTEELAEIIKEIYGILFDRLEANRDQQIQREELKVYYKCLGSASDEFVDKIFRKLDENHDGELTKNEFVKAGYDYWFSNDQSSGLEILYLGHD